MQNAYLDQKNFLIDSFHFLLSVGAVIFDKKYNVM